MRQLPHLAALAWVMLCCPAFAFEPEWRFRPVEPGFINEINNIDHAIDIAPNGNAVSAVSFNRSQIVVSEFSMAPTVPPIRHAIGANSGYFVRAFALPEGRLLYSQSGAAFVDNTGKLLWERNGEVSRPLRLTNGNLVFASGGSLVCIRYDTGNTLWTRNVVSAFPTSTVRAADVDEISYDGSALYATARVEITARSETLIKVDALTGSLEWAVSLPSEEHFRYQTHVKSSQIAVLIQGGSDWRFVRFNKINGSVTEELALEPSDNIMLFEPTAGEYVLQQYPNIFPYETDLFGIRNGAITWRKNTVSTYRFKKILGISNNDFVTLEYGYTLNSPAKIERRTLTTGDVVWSAPLLPNHPFYNSDLPTVQTGNTLRVAADYATTGAPGSIVEAGSVLADIDLTTGATLATHAIEQQRQTQPSATYSTNDTVLIGAAVDQVMNRLVVKAINKNTGDALWTRDWPVPSGTLVPAFYEDYSAVSANNYYVAVGESRGPDESYVTVMSIVSGDILYRTVRSFARNSPMSLGQFGLTQWIKSCGTCAFETRHLDATGTVKWSSPLYISAKPYNGKLVFADGNTSVSALDELTGQRLWQTSLTGFSIFTLQLIDGGIFVANRSSEVVRLDPSDGSVLWRKSIAVPDPRGSFSYLGGVTGGKLWLRLRSGNDLNTVYILNAANGAITSQYALSGEQVNSRVYALAANSSEILQQMLRPSFDGERKTFGVMALGLATGQPMGEHLLIGERPLVWQQGHVDEHAIDTIDNSVLMFRQAGINSQAQQYYGFGETVEKYRLPESQPVGDLTIRTISQGYSTVNAADQAVFEVENSSDVAATDVRFFSADFSFSDRIIGCERNSGPCMLTLPQNAEARFDLPARSKIQFTVLKDNYMSTYAFRYAIEPSYAYRDRTLLDNAARIYLYPAFNNGFE
jgi:outer membrane protein assembly factor BamB